MYSVWCYLQCQALTGGLGVHSLWFREDNHMWKQVERSVCWQHKHNLNTDTRTGLSSVPTTKLECKTQQESFLETLGFTSSLANTSLKKIFFIKLENSSTKRLLITAMKKKRHWNLVDPPNYNQHIYKADCNCKYFGINELCLWMSSLFSFLTPHKEHRVASQ